MNRTYEAPYSTQDLYFAAYIVATGICLSGLGKAGRSVLFEFEEPERCQQLALDWLNERDDDVQASVYARAIKSLKSIAMRGEL